MRMHTLNTEAGQQLTSGGGKSARQACRRRGRGQAQAVACGEFQSFGMQHRAELYCTWVNENLLSS